MSLKVNDMVEFVYDSTGYGRIDMVKGWLFKKYWVIYWGEDGSGKQTDPLFGTYARWCKPHEIRKRTRTKVANHRTIH